MANGEHFVDESAGQARVEGYLHRSEGGSNQGLVLTHGAGGDCNAALLVALAEGFSGSGMNVLRCNLPFRQARPQGPPSPGNAQADQAGLRRAAKVLAGLVGGKVFLGGQSYGGRQASRLASSDDSVADALLLLSYPLHPPGRPQQLRTAHLPTLQTPTLFVSGTKDPFGTIEELEAARGSIPGRTKLIAIDGAGHSLLTKKNRAELVGAVVDGFLEFVGGGP